MSDGVAKLALEDGTVYTGRAFGARGETLRRGRLQHQHDRLPGSPHRSVLQGPDRHHDLSAHRQLRHQRRGPRIGAGRRSRASSSANWPAIPSNFRSHGSLDAYLAEQQHHRPRGHRHPRPGPPPARPRRHDRRAVHHRSRRRLAGPQGADRPRHRRPRPGARGRCRNGRSTGTTASPARSSPTCRSRRPTHHVVALDFGMKWNILRCLVQVGCQVTVCPARASADDVLAHEARRRLPLQRPRRSGAADATPSKRSAAWSARSRSSASAWAISSWGWPWGRRRSS